MIQVKRLIWMCLGLSVISACAVLHHVQVGDLNDDPNFALRPFELKVSEVGFDVHEAGSVAKALTRSKTARKDVDRFTSIIELFQQGPRTGVPVFSDTYAQNIVNDLYKKCPSGEITGFVSSREMRKYPVISGEIVKIKGYCMVPRTSEGKGSGGDGPAKSSKSNEESK